MNAAYGEVIVEDLSVIYLTSSTKRQEALFLVRRLHRQADATLMPTEMLVGSVDVSSTRQLRRGHPASVASQNSTPMEGATRRTLYKWRLITSKR